MSASLVGSEMCIRDRLTAAYGCWQLLAPAYSCSQLLTAASTGLQLLTVAVSYTHLTLPTICSV
eukprot:9510732-Alexandrium_andersonii.AAC.1